MSKLNCLEELDDKECARKKLTHKYKISSKAGHNARTCKESQLS